MPSLRSPRLWLAALYAAGMLHWSAFFYLAYYPPGDRAFLRHVAAGDPPVAAREFTALDWYKEVNYHRLLHEALATRTIPYHSRDLSGWSPIRADRMMGAPLWPLSPQIALLAVLDPSTFIVVNLLLMYSVGFVGLLLIRKRYGLGFLPFSLLFLIFNFNGYLVAKVSAYGPGQYGYFLIPYFIVLLADAGLPLDVEREPSSASRRRDVRLGLLLGLVLAGMLYQGSLHFFVEAVTVLAIWGVIRYRRWLLTATAMGASFTAGALRLLPTAVTFGAAPNPHAIWGGYSRPETIVEALVLTRTSLTPPIWTWWEVDLYVSIFGVLAILYLALWAPILGSRWVRFSRARALYATCAVVTVISFRRFKSWVIPDWIPLLNAESLTTRYMIFVLLVLTVIAAVNLDGFLRRHGGRVPVVATWAGLVGALAVSLLNHSRHWRMHKVQAEFDAAIAQGLSGARADPSMQIVAVIDNQLLDTTYVMAIWLGFAISVIAVAIIAIALWKLRPNRPPAPQPVGG